MRRIAIGSATLVRARALRTTLLLLAIVLVAACGAPRAGLTVSPTTPAPLAELLVRMPAQDSAEEAELARALFDQGDAALTTLVSMLGSTEADDDAAARFAIESATRWANRPRRDDTRAVWAARLAGELDRVGGVERRRFLLAQLETVGGSAEVGAIAALLRDPDVGSDAARALGAVGGDAARDAVTTALREDSEPTLALVDAAGRLGAEGTRSALTAALTSTDRELRLAAASALADLAHPNSGVDLIDLLLRAEGLERSRLGAIALRYAARVEDPAHGVAVVNDVLEVADRRSDGALQLAALTALASVAPDDALARLRERDPEDPRTAAAMARLAARLEARMAAAERARAEAEEGFRRLFNGEDLSGWVGATDGYFVENGAIVCDPESGGNLYTEAEFDDFVLRFEFRLTPGANNGLGIRAPLEGDAAYVGMELQVLDNRALQYADLRPYQYHGSIYGVAAAERGHQRPVGQWNEQEVVADGRRIQVSLNGAVIVEVDLDEVSTPETADGRDHPGLSRASGHIGFLGHGHRVEYRNIRIRELR